MRFGDFFRDERGNIAITAAFTLLSMVTILGGGVDYTSAARVRSQLNSYADAAVLAAVGTSARSLTAEQAKAQTERVFRDSLPSDVGPLLTAANAIVTDSAGERSITLDYRANYKTTFMGIAGLNQLSLGGSVTARGSTPLYTDFYLLLDNSPSMGLGATQSDMDTLKASPAGCAFGCHVLSDSNDTYRIARSLGVNLRVDVVRTATQSLMDTAASMQVVPGQYRMALYTFGATARNERLTELFAPSSNLPAAKVAANGIELMAMENWGTKGYAATNFDEKLRALNSKIGPPGDGRTAEKPQKLVYIVSDGVADWNSPSCSGPLATGYDIDARTSFPRCFEPMNLHLCDSFKKRGVKIAVLHTAYLPMPGEGAYDAFVAPMADRIGASMQACASEGLYFLVQPTQGITEAMHALFVKAAGKVSLTR